MRTVPPKAKPSSRSQQADKRQFEANSIAVTESFIIGARVETVNQTEHRGEHRGEHRPEVVQHSA